MSYLVDASVIETDLTGEEKKWIKEGRKRYREHPEELAPLESIQLSVPYFAHDGGFCATRNRIAALHAEPVAC